MINFRTRYRKKNLELLSLNKISINYVKKSPEKFNLGDSCENKDIQSFPFKKSNNLQPKTSRYGRSTSSTDNQRDQVDFSDYRIKFPQRINSSIETHKLLLNKGQQQNVQSLNEKGENTSNKPVKQENYENSCEKIRAISQKQSTFDVGDLYNSQKMPLNYQNRRKQRSKVSEMSRSLKLHLLPQIAQNSIKRQMNAQESIRNKLKSTVQTSQGMRFISRLTRYEQKPQLIEGWEGDNFTHLQPRKYQIVQYLQKQQAKQQLPSANLSLDQPKVLTSRSIRKQTIKSRKSVQQQSKSISSKFKKVN